MPRGDTLDRTFADRLLAWVRAGGTLIVTDPDAFTRTPAGAPLADVRDALVGAPLGPARRGSCSRCPRAPWTAPRPTMG